MRINTFYYFIFFTCFTCVSCAQTTVNQCVVEKVEVDMKTLCNCSLSDISSDVTFLKLENNSSSFIQQVSKWVAFDHKIYIADKKQKRIFIFDSRGKYLNVIGQFGRGETEIFEFADFTIDVYNGKIIILDTGNKKLLYYTTDGVFLETQRFSQVWNITSLNKDLYAVYYAQRKKFDIDILSKNGNVINQYLPIEDCLIDNKVSFNMHYFSKNHLGETMLLPYLSSIAYKVTPDSIIPKYSFDFGINTLPQDFFVDAFSEISNIKSSKMRYDLRQKTWNEVYQKKYVYATSSFKESYNYLYF